MLVLTVYVDFVMTRPHNFDLLHVNMQQAQQVTWMKTTHASDLGASCGCWQQQSSCHSARQG